MVPEMRKERREERIKQRRERRERHRGEKWSILVTVCVSRVPGGGVQNCSPGHPGPLSGCGFWSGLPQHQLFRLGFGLIRDFSENTSPQKSTTSLRIVQVLCDPRRQFTRFLSSYNLTRLVAQRPGEYYIILYYSIQIQYSTVQVQYSTVQYGTVQYNKVQCNVQQCNIFYCNIMQCSVM